MTKTLSINKLYANLKNFTDPQTTKEKKYHKLFYSGVHLGHKCLKVKSGWHSSVSTFLLGSRNNSGILKSKLTLTCFLKAFYILTVIVKSGGQILIINTNPEFSKLLQHVKKNSRSSKIFYSDCHWVGGTLTNWAQINQCVSTFINFYHRFDLFLLQNNIHFPRYKKMKKSFKGFIIKKQDDPHVSSSKINTFKDEKASFALDKISNISKKTTNKQKNINLVLQPDWKPDLVFILSFSGTEGIIREATSLQIPIIALIDSNTNISNITYPIPTNNNCFIFAWFCLDWITRITNKYCSSLQLRLSPMDKTINHRHI